MLISSEDQMFVFFYHVKPQELKEGTLSFSHDCLFTAYCLNWQICYKLRYQKKDFYPLRLLQGLFSINAQKC